MSSAQRGWTYKASRLAYHLAHGTLPDVLRGRYRNYRQRKVDGEWEQCKSAGKPYLTRLANGVRIYLYPDDTLSVGILKHNFERKEQKFVRNLLRPGDTFVDVGANIGLFSLNAAPAVGARGRVYAIEPTPTTFKRLLENVQLNHLKNVCCFQFALSDKAERRMLTESRDGYPAFNSLGRPSAGEVFAQEEVLCTTWDQFASDHELHGRVTLMKIDVEGWELYALNGGEGTLRRSDAPDLLVEFTEKNARSAGTSCAAVYRRLEEFGYRIHAFDASQRRLWHDPLRDKYSWGNLLATKRIAWVASRLGYVVL